MKSTYPMKRVITYNHVSVSLFPAFTLTSPAALCQKPLLLSAQQHRTQPKTIFNNNIDKNTLQQ
jgi:hypothetical protein